MILKYVTSIRFQWVFKFINDSGAKNIHEKLRRAKKNMKWKTFYLILSIFLVFRWFSSDIYEHKWRVNRFATIRIDLSFISFRLSLADKWDK